MAFVIVPFEKRHHELITSLALRAWEPVFASLKSSLPRPIYASFYPNGWEARHRSEIDAVCESPDCKLWIAEDALVPVGFAAIKFHPAERMGEIYIIGVEPRRQAEGIGSALTSFCLERMREAGMAIAMVDTASDPGHAPARRTYEKAGFDLWPVARYFREL
jgi:GNAT superfamily N-acetyltransferase